MPSSRSLCSALSRVFRKRERSRELRELASVGEYGLDSIPVLLSSMGKSLSREFMMEARGVRLRVGSLIRRDFSIQLTAYSLSDFQMDSRHTGHSFIDRGSLSFIGCGSLGFIDRGGLGLNGELLGDAGRYVIVFLASCSRKM
jgi:hypothetical protein